MNYVKYFPLPTFGFGGQWRVGSNEFLFCGDVIMTMKLNIGSKVGFNSNRRASVLFFINITFIIKYNMEYKSWWTIKLPIIIILTIYNALCRTWTARSRKFWWTAGQTRWSRTSRTRRAPSITADRAATLRWENNNFWTWAKKKMFGFDTQLRLCRWSKRSSSSSTLARSN